MKRALACLTLVTLAACAGSAPPAAPGLSESDRLNAWFEQQYERELRFSPLQLTSLGRKDLNDQLDDFSPAAFERQLRWQRDSVREMQRRFDYDALDESARLSWDLWKYRHEMAAASLPWREREYLFQQMDGMQSQLPMVLINFHAVDSLDDLEAYLSRLEALPRAMDQLLQRARSAARAGIRPPRFAYEQSIDQARRVISGIPFDAGPDDSALWADLVAKIDALVTRGSISPSQTVALKQAASEALLRHVQPAYQRVISWLQSDLPDAPVNASGVSSTQRNGLKYYELMLRRMTTTDLTPDQIHRIGLEEVARLRAQMESLRQQVGFEGDLTAFFRFLDTDPRFRYPNTDEGRQAYLDAATAAIDNIRRQLPQFFGRLPKAELVVRRVESFREEAGAAQHYFAPAPDGSRPGIYYVHLIDMQAMPKTSLEAIAYHEGLPGHHMQVAIAQELEGLPLFRRQGVTVAYAEGWALYTEWLAKEMSGTYTDPYSRFGQLINEMFRAVRLVVDTGLHAKGWSEQQAVDYFLQNTPMPETAVRAEVQRYLVLPGQATAYKIGMLKVQELRRRAEAALGERFDLRAFHDAVLDGGSLPLDLLERRIDAWIAARSP